MIDFATARRVSEVMAAVADPTRVRIILQLTRGPMHVGRLAEALKVPRLCVSHHLRVMRDAGLVDDERDGRRIVYRLRDDVCAADGPDGCVSELDLGTFRLVVKEPVAV